MSNASDPTRHVSRFEVAVFERFIMMEKDEVRALAACLHPIPGRFGEELRHAITQAAVTRSQSFGEEIKKLFAKSEDPIAVEAARAPDEHPQDPEQGF